MKKGMDELEEVELTRRPDTTFHAVQAAGCAPVVKSFETGDQLVHPVKPDTKIKSLAVGNPADGAAALDIIRRSQGEILVQSELNVGSTFTVKLPIEIEL